MRVKIIPLKYESYNYGGVLQYYALQRYFLERGYDCTIIDIDNDSKLLFEQETRKNVKNPFRLLYRKYKKYRTNRLSVKFSIRREKFNLFREEYIKKENWKVSNSKSGDLYIAGSDQIWNPNYTTKYHFLDFEKLDAIKMIYGASIGKKELTETIQKKYLEFLPKLDFISVRENGAKEIIKKFYNGEVTVVLDPIFLIPSYMWFSLLKKQSEYQYIDYVFGYFIGNNKNARKLIKTVSKKRKKIKIYGIPYVNQNYTIFDNYADLNIIEAGPLDFLELIKNANIVVTDSFHAAAFSLLFHKEFYVCNREQKGNDMIDRIDTLLRSVNLEDRLIFSEEQIDSVRVIDWIKVDQLISKELEKSLIFIENGIEACK